MRWKAGDASSYAGKLRRIFIRWKAGDASGFKFWEVYIFILLSFENPEMSL
jgi:hypothetical protein